MSQEEIGRRALLVGAGCAALAALGACSREPDVDAGPAKGTVLTSRASVPIGGGVLTQEGYLVLQLQEGRFTAFNGVCPHQNYLVRPPDEQGVLVCSGHRSTFRASDGTRIDGPALGNLTPIPVEVSGANIVRA